MGKLTVAQCHKLVRPGKYSDGKGLHLLVCKNGSKYWRQAYRFNGKQKTAAFGVFPFVSLKEARLKQMEFKIMLAKGIDPYANATKHKKISFGEVTKKWFENTKKVRNWGENRQASLNSFLKKHILPSLGDIDIRYLKSIQIIKLIQRLDQEGKVATANECLALIKRICNFAVSLEIREASPAAHLKEIISPYKSKPHPHSLLPDEISSDLKAIQKSNLNPILENYFKLLPILFCRPSELRMMRWQDIDNGFWILPPEITKKKRTHIVPLSTQAIKILSVMKNITGNNQFVFSDFSSQKEPIGRWNIYQFYPWKYFSPHGWRHTASSLLNEWGFNSDHIELQLSHVDKNKSRGTYNHANYLGSREIMMQQWADYLDILKKN